MTNDLQRLYDAVTWLISVAPSGRIDEGATVPYHDALLAVTSVRDELRRTRAVTHDETYWQKHLEAEEDGIFWRRAFRPVPDTDNSQK